MEDVRTMTYSSAPNKSTNEGVRKPMQNPRRLAALVAMSLSVIVPAPALAYIGPGAGLGAVTVTIALVLGVLLLVVGLVWYPLKRVLKVKKGDASNSGS